jgi:hypothetical protein
MLARRAVFASEQKMRRLTCVGLAIAAALALAGQAAAWRAKNVKGRPGAVTVMRVHGSLDSQGHQYMWFRAGSVYRSQVGEYRNTNQLICASYLFFTISNGRWITSGQQFGPFCSWVAPGRRLVTGPLNNRQAIPLSAYRVLEVVTWGVTSPARQIASEVIDLRDAGDYMCDPRACEVYTKYSPANGSPIRSWLYFPYLHFRALAR